MNYRKEVIIVKNKRNYNRLKSAASALRLLMQLCFWASLAAAVLTAVIGLALIAIPGAYSLFAKPFSFSKGSPVIELNDMLRYSIDPGVVTVEKMKPVYLAIIFRTSICGFIIAPFLYQLKSILKSAENSRPFEVKNAGRLTWMGAFIIAYSIVYRIGEYVALQTTLNVINVPDMTVNYTFNTSWVIMGILLFILAGIFKYGSYLQDEFDATL